MNVAPRIVACVLLASWMTVNASSSTLRAQPNAEAELIALEHKWIDVTIKGDADAFAAFLADGYVALVANARIRSKAEWVEGVRSGSLKYESVDLHDLKVRLYGDTAVVTGEYTQKATSGGQDYSARGAYANTWLKRGGRWQVIASGFSRRSDEV